MKGRFGGYDLDDAIKTQQADVVLVSAKKDDGPSSHGELLIENPALKILALSGDGRFLRKAT